MAAGLPTGLPTGKEYTKSFHRIDRVDGVLVFTIPPINADDFFHDPRRFIVKNGYIIAFILGDDQNPKVCPVVCKYCSEEFDTAKFLSIAHSGPQRCRAVALHKIFTEDDVAKANLWKELGKHHLIKYHADPALDLHDPDCGRMCCHCPFSWQQLIEFYWVYE